jgi:redox-sensitive bicupin YhaK (pirin superfamily)
MNDSPIELVIAARHGDLGNGLVVRRVLPFSKRRMVGPFIFLDHAGPLTIAADAVRAADVRPHPHIGLSTVSYLLGGQMTHRDSLGITQVILPGEVNWMTAGRGISHSERFEHPASFAGGGLELLQSWVALPEADEECAPAFDNYPADALPVADGDGTWLRLIAGEAYGLRSPVTTRSPLFYVHAARQAGARMALPHGHAERAVYVAAGNIEAAGQIFATGQMIVFARDADTTLRAVDASTVMLLGGESVGPRHIWWNFVSSHKARIEQAKADWQAGRIALPPHDNADFIPLPG